MIHEARMRAPKARAIIQVLPKLNWFLPKLIFNQGIILKWAKKLVARRATYSEKLVARHKSSSHTRPCDRQGKALPPMFGLGPQNRWHYTRGVYFCNFDRIHIHSCIPLSFTFKIREFDISRKIYIRGCLHYEKGRTVGITYKKKKTLWNFDFFGERL